MMDRLVISPQEAAKMLRISMERTYRLLSRGDIPAYLEGTHWKIPIESLQKYVTQRAEKEAEERKNIWRRQ